MSKAPTFHTEKIKVFLHRKADGELNIYQSDQSQWSWCGICVAELEFDINFPIPSEQEMLLQVKKYFDKAQTKAHAEAEKLAAELREKEQQYFALPTPTPTK